MSIRTAPRVLGLLIVSSLLIGAAPSSKKRISINLMDADVHNVFRLFAEVGQVNFVVSEHVEGKVTLKLKQVPWDEALTVVLRSKSLGMEKVGSVYHIDTLERLTAAAELRSKIKESKHKAAPLRTVLIPVNYAKAADLVPLIKTLLTDRGRVQVDPRTNTLIVTDVAESTRRVGTTVRGK